MNRKELQKRNEDQQTAQLPEMWRIIRVVISSRCTADVHFAEKIVRIRGELCAHYFLANPYTMIRITEAESRTAPWLLDQGRQKERLSESDCRNVMNAVNDYYRNKTEPVIFLTKEAEDYAFDLADAVKERRISKRKAIRLYQKAFPDYTDSFCRGEIESVLLEIRWFPTNEITDI